MGSFKTDGERQIKNQRGNLRKILIVWYRFGFRIIKNEYSERYAAEFA
jgi:hypothetical protein